MPEVRPPVTNAVVVDTEHGRMIVNRYDLNQTEALFRHGKALDHREVDFVAGVLGALHTDPVVLDVGANFGTWSLGLARRIGNGVVHAFEAQRIIFNMLAGTTALNGLLNVHCHNLAIGAEDGRLEVPQYDYYRQMNFGSVEFGREQGERLFQERGHDPARLEYVSMRSIDSLDFPRVDFIKLDIEGMEEDAVRGAERTLRRDEPLMFVEVLKCDRDSLRARLEALGYTARHLNEDNVFCVPAKHAGRFSFG